MIQSGRERCCLRVRAPSGKRSTDDDPEEATLSGFAAHCPLRIREDRDDRRSSEFCAFVEFAGPQEAEGDSGYSLIIIGLREELGSVNLDVLTTRAAGTKPCTRFHVESFDVTIASRTDIGDGWNVTLRGHDG